jgi:CRISPR/Cas system type I-B associated protein Csh2 (Cas7 group RAMP superfamily)
MEKEKAKAMSIKDDMISLMEEARKEGIDVRNFSNSLAVDRSKSIRGV